MARPLLVGPTAQCLPLVCDVRAQEGVPVTEAAHTYQGFATAAAARPGAGLRDIASLVIDHHVPGLPPAGDSLRAKSVSLWNWAVLRCALAVVRRSLMSFYRSSGLLLES